jgi:hypothetical protein
VNIKVNRRNAMSNSFSTKAFVAIQRALSAEKYKHLTIPLLHEYCHHTRCINCTLTRDNKLCACEFKRAPIFWDMPKIAKILNAYKRKRDKEIARGERKQAQRGSGSAKKVSE